MLPGLSSFAPYRCASDKPELCLLFYNTIAVWAVMEPNQPVEHVESDCKVNVFF